MGWRVVDRIAESCGQLPPWPSRSQCISSLLYEDSFIQLHHSQSKLRRSSSSNVQRLSPCKCLSTGAPRIALLHTVNTLPTKTYINIFVEIWIGYVGGGSFSSNPDLLIFSNVKKKVYFRDIVNMKSVDCTLGKHEKCRFYSRKTINMKSAHFISCVGWHVQLVKNEWLVCICRSAVSCPSQGDGCRPCLSCLALEPGWWWQNHVQLVFVLYSVASGDQGWVVVSMYELIIILTRCLPWCRVNREGATEGATRYAGCGMPGCHSQGRVSSQWVIPPKLHVVQPASICYLNWLSVICSDQRQRWIFKNSPGSISDHSYYESCTRVLFMMMMSFVLNISDMNVEKHLEFNVCIVATDK